MEESETQSHKIFTVHRVVGRYEIEGTITFVPAPPPGTSVEFIQTLIDAQIFHAVRDHIVRNLLCLN